MAFLSAAAGRPANGTSSRRRPLAQLGITGGGSCVIRNSHVNIVQIQYGADTAASHVRPRRDDHNDHHGAGPTRSGMVSMRSSGHHHPPHVQVVLGSSFSPWRHVTPILPSPGSALDMTDMESSVDADGMDSDLDVADDEDRRSDEGDSDDDDAGAPAGSDADASEADPDARSSGRKKTKKQKKEKKNRRRGGNKRLKQNNGNGGKGSHKSYRKKGCKDKIRRDHQGRSGMKRLRTMASDPSSPSLCSLSPDTKSCHGPDSQETVILESRVGWLDSDGHVGDSFANPGLEAAAPTTATSSSMAMVPAEEAGTTSMTPTSLVEAEPAPEPTRRPTRWRLTAHFSVMSLTP